jgi:ribonuclease HI
MKLTIHTDGGSRGNPGPAAAGVVLADSDTRNVVHEAGYFLGRMTNNVAEYRGLVRAVELAVHLRASAVEVMSDSELMVRQIKGQYKVKSPELIPLWGQAMQALGRIGKWQITHVRREFNHRADELCNLALDAQADVVRVSCDGTPTTVASAVISPAAGGQVCFTAVLPTAAGAACPLPPTAGELYDFGPGTPGGFCVNAAAAVLGHELSGKPVGGGGVAKVFCRRCGARIDIRRPPSESGA